MTKYKSPGSIALQNLRQIKVQVRVFLSWAFQIGPLSGKSMPNFCHLLAKDFSSFQFWNEFGCLSAELQFVVDELAAWSGQLRRGPKRKEGCLRSLRKINLRVASRGGQIIFRAHQNRCIRFADRVLWSLWELLRSHTYKSEHACRLKSGYTTHLWSCWRFLIHQPQSSSKQ